MATKLFSKEIIETTIDVGNALDVVERTYVETARDRVQNPSKLTMHLGDDGEWPHLNAFTIDMPAYVEWLDVVGMKWAVATWDGDADVPINSLILLFDLENGRFKAVMEGMYLTGIRTALQSVVGLKHLLPSTPDSVGIFGAGFQAEFQLSVIDEILDVGSFIIYDINNDAAQNMTDSLSDQIDANILPVYSPEEAADNEVLITVTNSKTPVLNDHWLDGTDLIVALGSYRELQDHTITSADHLVVDHVEQCLHRGPLADLVHRNELAKSDIDATVGEILNDDYQKQIDENDQRVFVPIGLGCLDISIAETAYRSNTQSNTIPELEFI